MTTLEAALSAADLDARVRPDGLLVIDRPDGSYVVLGEDAGGDWWDFAVYGADGGIVLTDGRPTIAAVVDAVSSWTIAARPTA